jgi:vacuolar protein sorting-associated protein 13A/C
VYAVSYIDNSQRVIVFTTDRSIADIERKKEASTMEIYVLLKGILISVINDVNLEIAAISIKDGKSIWSIKKGNEERVYTQEYCDYLEKCYTKHVLSSNKIYASLCNNDNKTDEPKMNANNKKENAKNINNKLEVDFKKMRLIKPESGELKRSWQPGLFVQYRVSANLMSLKCCVYNMQIDNQLPDAYFPISFFKAPKKYTTIDNYESSRVPFLTMSIFTEQQEVTQIFRCFDWDFQEFYLKLDVGFLVTMKNWYDSASITTTKEDRTFDLSADEEATDSFNRYFNLVLDKDTQTKIDNDLKLTKEIMEYASPTGAVKQSAHIRFDDFFLSPIVFNLSFSVNGTPHATDGGTDPLTDSILNFFLESIGASLTEFKDIKFKFERFDMNNETKTWKEMYDLIFNHYQSQALRQVYILVLGLDVLGNPFGLMSEFSKGISDLFYDPLLNYLSKSNYQGDFKMKHRIKQTIDHTISTAAASGSLISGSFGRVLAACTFDKEYKKVNHFL